MNKGVKDKYVWKKEQKKADEEVCSALKSRVLAQCPSPAFGNRSPHLLTVRARRMVRSSSPSF
eukprot:3049061-Rhodomonas_salina.1